MPRADANPPAEHHDAPPPIRSGRRRMALVIASGVVVSIILLFVVLQVESPQPLVQPAPAIAGAQELIAPTDLQPEDVTGGGFDPERSVDVALPQGMTIEVQEDDRLAQRYRCSHSDPRPGGWIHMDQPEVELYLSDDRLLVMTGDSALVHIPQRALVSGTLTGNVVIRLFELSEDAPIDIHVDEPALRVVTGEARFDNFLGEIRCDGEVDIQRPELWHVGTGLRLKINDQLRRPEQLDVEKTRFIRLASLPESTEVAAAEPSKPATPAREKPLRNAGEPKEPRKTAQRDPAASRPAKRDRPPRDGRAVDESPFYIITLNDNVHIRQGDGVTGWTADGDELRLIFSFKSGNFQDALSQGHPAEPFIGPLETIPRAIGGTGLSLTAALSTLALAAISDDVQPTLYRSSQDEITITFSGPMTMVPLEDAARKPKSTDDSHLELVGRPVHLVSHADSANVECASLQYETLSKTLRLRSSKDSPLTMSSPEFSAGGSEFWLDQIANKAGFDDDGWLVLNVSDSQSPRPEALSEPVRITWTGRMRLNFSRAPGAKSATPQGSTTTAAMRAGLLKHVAFRGSVAVTSSQGRMNADDLAVDLTQTKGGQTIPTLVTAKGHVMAFDQGQIVWADEIVAKLREITSAAAPATQPEGLVARGRNVELETLNAGGDVQIRLPDGSRAFADILDANAIDGTLVLESPDLLIASQTMLIDQGSRLKLNRDSKTALWPGPGRARVFRTPIISDVEERIARPVVDVSVNPVQVLATWATDMTFDSTVNDGAGALTLRGDVKGDSTRTVLELSTLVAGVMTLEFAHAAKDATLPQSEATIAESQALQSQSDLLQRGNRQLLRLIATDNARLESRNWENEDHSDKPRVFYLAGQEIDYNNLTLEAGVPGPGEMLVRDERVEPLPADGAAPNTTSGRAPFAARGTSLFKWSQRLDMVRTEGDLYTITMLGDVDAIHRDITGRETVFKGQTLEAAAIRTLTDRATEAAVDMGGSMELKRLRAAGAVFVRSPERDITCDEFDYNLISAMARLAAKPGSNVMVITRGSPHPMRAEEMQWNMETDTITVIRGAGTVPR